MANAAWDMFSAVEAIKASISAGRSEMIVAASAIARMARLGRIAFQRWRQELSDRLPPTASTMTSDQAPACILPACVWFCMQLPTAAESAASSSSVQAPDGGRGTARPQVCRFKLL